LYLQKAVVGGFIDFFYLSSTELSINNVWVQGFTSGGEGGYVKNDYCYVRAIRAF